jgi:nitrate/nitrite-specific signal transduction histidine kinase
MDQYTMVVAIVAISVAAGVYTTYLKARTRERASSVSEAGSDEMRAEIARLKERVRVLESIVTDKDRVLAEEIRKLG